MSLEKIEAREAAGDQGWGVIPQDRDERKRTPITTGVLDYFPAALAAVAKVSLLGNEQHNPGEPLHWARNKSLDHADCIARHLIERGTKGPDGVRHSAALAWRALALLQEEMEREGAQVPVTPRLAGRPIAADITDRREKQEHIRREDEKVKSAAAKDLRDDYDVRVSTSDSMEPFFTNLAKQVEKGIAEEEAERKASNAAAASFLRDAQWTPLEILEALFPGVIIGVDEGREGHSAMAIMMSHADGTFELKDIVRVQPKKDTRTEADHAAEDEFIKTHGLVPATYRGTPLGMRVYTRHGWYREHAGDRYVIAAVDAGWEVRRVRLRNTVSGDPELKSASRPMPLKDAYDYAWMRSIQT